MLKNILISGLLCTFLSAESFDTFLQRAIQNSPYLESSKLSLSQAKEKGSVLTRYKNPTLELEYSNFSPDTTSSDNGYRVNYSQPIRLWNVSNNSQSLAKNMLNSASANFTQQKAIFVRDISIYFSSFANQKMLLELGDEELSIAKTIYDISKARYESGTISRGLMLQSKIDYENIQISNESLSLSFTQSYYNLLRFAGINEEIVLEAKYTFKPNTSYVSVNNPNIKLLKAQKETSLSQAKLNSNKISWMKAFAEFESEPEQDITRVGFNVPLAFFNTKKEEMNIAKLQARRSQLLIDNETKRLAIELKRLKKERSSLKNLKMKNEEILDTELELLKMFQNGYKIANINLLQLQDVKNRVIFTKRSLIQINTALNKNAITLNYNQGLYND